MFMQLFFHFLVDFSLFLNMYANVIVLSQYRLVGVISMWYTYILYIRFEVIWLKYGILICFLRFLIAEAHFTNIY